ncbi:MAG: DNA topoisomerase I, partial [Planctomycetes bacterium]|nr:DNA topoisomerase I [Planctomycetota bacterium]
MKKTLIICEKPTAATKIAAALADKRPKKQDFNGVPYYEFSKDGGTIVVVSALGHLFTLKNTRPMREYPIYDIAWVPSYEVDKRALRSQGFVEAITELAKGADEFINATDFDIEGAVIGFNVLNYLCGGDAPKRAKRMKFSTLTTDELVEAYDNLLPKMDAGMVDSGLARHLLDWYWGMNVSKAMSASVEAAHGRFAKLSAGRVQTPTLKILQERELEIRAFKSDPYWVIELLFKLDGMEIAAAHKTDRFFDKPQADRVRKVCKGKPAKITKITTRKYTKMPPPPFDLGQLQAEAYRCFGYTPARTQQLAQSLYDGALISYPRTSSQKLPPAIGYAKIIKRLSKVTTYKKLAEKLLARDELVPHEGSKTDSAHPAVYPTGEKAGRLQGPKKRLYDLITRRFLATFSDPAVKESVRVDLDVAGEQFHLNGRRTLELGWLEFYGPYGATEEVILPELKEGQELKPETLSFEEKETQPPPRYNPASIVKEMEERNLGTKATRAPILQNIYNRNYITGTPIEVSELGMKIMKSLIKYCPEIASEELTTHFEKEMEEIQAGTRNKDEVLEEAKERLSAVLEQFRKSELKIGKVLGIAYRDTMRKQKMLGACIKCHEPMKIIVSRKTKKRFAGCTSYPKCTNSYPLPQRGYITSLDKVCEECGTPVIQVKRMGTRPYRMCINHKCITKA